ncbi:MAG: hypothetical protein BGN86_02635 [Caulobacterales bacterium 68-7]|nr:flavin reductase family protein [Caulobacterales bacterium]OJU08435.1 MAG: hypothetical protein BGN86_02635 [Caulobacterales bacterium 68-7]
MNRLSDIGEDAELRRVFSRFPTGVTALCAMVDGKPVGMTASAFVAISLKPALASVCIKHGSATWRDLRSRERVGISFLGHGHAATARQLAQKTGDRFVGLDYEVTADGALLLANATAWLECSVENQVAAGDHVIAIFRIHRTAAAEGVMPLVFHSSGFHTIAPIGEQARL